MDIVKDFTGAKLPAGTIRHIVMWKLKGENKEENAKQIKERLEGLVGKIDGLISAAVYPDMTGGSEGNFDLCLDSLFVNYGALEKYKVHPLHAAISEFVKNVRTDRKCVDFEV